MGFENRKAKRIKVDLNICYWPANQIGNMPVRGRALNLSETGMAFLCASPALPGELLILEFSLPGFQRPLRLTVEVVDSRAADAQDLGYEMRVKFLKMEAEELKVVTMHVLEAYDPKLAARMGFGRAYFTGQEAVDFKYRLLDAGEAKGLLDGRGFLGAKDFSLLKNFQAILQAAFGTPQPAAFKMTGSRPLKERQGLWVEFQLAHGPLETLADVLWAVEPEKGPAEAGLNLLGFHKDQALKLEKKSDPRLPSKN